MTPENPCTYDGFEEEDEVRNDHVGWFSLHGADEEGMRNGHHYRAWNYKPGQATVGVYFDQCTFDTFGDLVNAPGIRCSITYNKADRRWVTEVKSCTNETQ